MNRALPLLTQGKPDKLAVQALDPMENEIACFMLRLNDRASFSRSM